jgi:hypothetical protein
MFLNTTAAVMVVNDTLATTPETDALMLVSKCFVVPHLNMVIASTGAAEIGQRWAHMAQTRMLCRGIDMCDCHAPDMLRRIRGEVESESGPMPGTATVYHFGLSEERDHYVGYAYRSEKDFRSEELGEGFGVKPVPAVIPDDVPASLEEWLDLAVALRAEQDALPVKDRVCIGGELFLTRLADGGIGVTKIFRFPDFEQQWLEMNARLA